MTLLRIPRGTAPTPTSPTREEKKQRPDKRLETSEKALVP